MGDVAPCERPQVSQTATVAEADLIVSWNFRHIVHFDKIRLYNAVNTMKRYRSVEIRSPLEAIDYEDENL